VEIRHRALHRGHDRAARRARRLRPRRGRYTLYAGTGGAVRQKKDLAAVLGVDESKVRVITRDVGGNFGSKNRVYVEYGLALWASRKLGRPVKFTASRSESFVSDYQGRDLVTEVELALRSDGRFLAMRASNLSNVGARCVSLSPLSKGSGLVTGADRDLGALPRRADRGLDVVGEPRPRSRPARAGCPAAGIEPLQSGDFIARSMFAA